MRLALLTGGSSAERNVALASAAQVVSALRAKGHEVTVIDTADGPVSAADESALLSVQVSDPPPDLTQLAARERRFLVEELASLDAVRQADAVFLGLHGGWGENGTLQALLEMIGVPYTGSRPEACAVAMDKDLAKRVLRQGGVATADWLMAPARPETVVRELGLPVVVKPSREGSTVGLTVVRQAAKLAAAIAEAGRWDSEVLIEAFVPGRELTCGVLIDEALTVGEIIPQHELFDYQCKYTPGMSREIFPAELPDELADEVRRLSLEAHRLLKLGSYSRVDFRLTPSGQPLCLEANTLPGLTSTSLLPQSAKASGIDFADLCDTICRNAVRPDR